MFRMSIVHTERVRYTVGMARSEQFPIKFQFAISNEMDGKIAAWRRQQPDLPNRSEAIRRLVETGLFAEPVLADIVAMLERFAETDEDLEIARQIAAIRAVLRR